MDIESINDSIIGLVDLFICQGDVSQLVAFHKSSREAKDHIDRNINIIANQLRYPAAKLFQEVVTCYDNATFDEMVNSHRTLVPLIIHLFM